MITTIHIKNIGIIDDVTIDLKQGFNVLTGETGAGKTLIIDSLGIICGGRFSKEMIRKGETYSYIEASIYLPKNEIASEDNIIVSREIDHHGKNLCKINGRLSTVNELKAFMKNVVDIHGQNDNQSLLDKNAHTAYLDSFIGDTIKKVKQEYRSLYEQYQEIKEQLKQNYGDEKEKQRRLDLLQYQFKEIENAKLKPQEEIELEEKKTKMHHSERIAENLNIANQALEDNTIDELNVAIRALEKISHFEQQYEGKLTELKSVYYEVQEIARDISNMKEEVYFNEEERNEVEERLDLIFSLKRKYGNSIEEILQYQKEVEEEIEKIENLEEINKKLKQDQEKIEEKMKKLCQQMDKTRREQAKILVNCINQELEQLEMKNATFCVQIEWKEEEFNKNGSNQIEFQIATNLGEDKKPLIKIASGGEMSRIMLAIKSVLAQSDKVPILIFDEIDTGISGKAAKAVGEKLKAISKYHQVICVTHQASIAAKGDYNYFISKKIQEDKTVTEVQPLNEEETIKEIARIASGDITPITIQHAIELRKVG